MVAGINGLPVVSLAKQSLGQSDSEELFTDSPRPDEKKRPGKPTA